ncbi:CerR family C-terminal domain-containing protein, partial [Acinetobacter baumannii]
FDGRDGLYQAVLMEAHAHYLDEQYLLELVESTYPPEEKLSLLLETLLHKLTEKDVWHGKVFIRELFSPSEHLLNFIELTGMRKFFLIRKLISQVANLDENDPAVLPCILSVMTPCMMLIIAGPNAQAPEPLKNIAQMPLHDLVEHFKKFLLAGLKAISQSNLKN